MMWLLKPCGDYIYFCRCTQELVVTIDSTNSDADATTNNDSGDCVDDTAPPQAAGMDTTATAEAATPTADSASPKAAEIDTAAVP